MIKKINNHKLKIERRDWQKRRDVQKNEKMSVKDFSIDDLKKEKNHICYTTVIYEDNSKERLVSRVVENQITKELKIDAMKFTLIFI
tara:strand:+ start:30338 stop:30598 length:261 start_codon:yes stop_codon:yes gene_type:complete